MMPLGKCIVRMNVRAALLSRPCQIDSIEARNPRLPWLSPTLSLSAPRASSTPLRLWDQHRCNRFSFVYGSPFSLSVILS